MLSNIRNFCIIAHIDHGKSTLADRILQITQTVDDRSFQDQLLDSMDLERERGITIKSHPVSMSYTAKDGKTYLINLIDTPGHVDFSYEVSRSMAACEAAILLIDAAQGVQAQTVANTYLAIDNDLEIIPVLNKIDLPSADVEGAKHQVEEALAIPMDDCGMVSSKTGVGVDELMEMIVQKVPPPESENPDGPLRAIIFDSVYDVYRGVIAYVRIVDGTIKTGDDIYFMGTDITTQVKEVGIFSPEMKPAASLSVGTVGYIIGTVKDPKEIRCGDTITTRANPASEALPGFREIRPMVFAGLYPVATDEYEKIRNGLEKLQLNDSAFTWHTESSVALGFGFRCGFLGLLHMEVVQERLRREFECDIISTHPAVIYKIHHRNGKVEEIDNPIRMPDPMEIDYVEEPMIKATVITPTEYIGDIMRVVLEHRGIVEKTDSLDGLRVILTCILPLNEILIDFNDTLKSVSRGYASMDYDHYGYQVSDIIRMDILLNGEAVDAFSCMVHKDRAVERGRQICAILKEVIPPHMFRIPIQAAIGRTIIAREDVRAFRKDVTAKLYGGDVTRKQKLLSKQKEGKKRMKQFGTVNVPQEAFVAVLRSKSEQ
ncbi:MAG: elongation factor 4 [Lentisphaerae bacterium]|jgi:GTP-binding protein LepA|nr:elongation factor 4 [Lentisphaerota bacterium]